jgi:hypothetical protein
MTLSKEEWLESYGWCETLQNTAAVLAKLEQCIEGDLGQQFRVWSECERNCEDGDYFAGTRWSEIMPGVYRNAVRFYLREKPAQSWILVSGGIDGRRNRNSYSCEKCGHEWTDEYPGSPDDDCDRCGSRHYQPWRTEELDAHGKVVRA